MTRVSLREAYDNKDVVAQILSIRDTAESAVDTSEQAVTTANTASDHVDALVPQVEGAVQNANSASASAQASAQTVAGYENRLGAVEDATEDLSGDLNAVTLRVTTAEGDIVTIQGRVTAIESKNTQQDTAISALQTADAQNVKITGEHAIGNYAVLLTNNQSPILGQKVFDRNVYNSTTIATATSDWRCVAKMPASTSGTSVMLMVGGHGSAIFNLIHYQCRNHAVRAVSIATTGDYNGKIAFVGDGTNEYMFMSSASNHEIYPIGGNKSVPLVYDNLPTDTYPTVEALTADYVTSVII